MRYLVTGGSGKLGSLLVPMLDAIAPAHQDMNILDGRAVEQFIARLDIGAVIHLAALCDRKKVEANRELAHEINVNGSKVIAQAAARHGKKAIYLSTERVFDGKHGNYRESDPPCPPDWYGATKAAGEQEVLRASPRNLVIRTSFRPTPWPFPTAFSDVITTADYTDVIAQDVTRCLALNLSGIIHLGTPAKTMLALARRTSPEVVSELCPDRTMGKRLDLNIEKWLALRNPA